MSNAKRSSLEPRFSLGRTLATPGALAALSQAGQMEAEFFARHQLGDWGDLNEVEKQQNERNLERGSRLLSAYVLNSGVKIWAITEADQSVTTLLLPEGY